MSCWVLTSPYRPQGNKRYFSVNQQDQRSLQWSQERWTGDWVNSDWEARTGRRWFQEPRAPLLQKSLLWTYRYGTLWNFLFWPQNTLTYDIKINYPSVHWPQQKRKHPIQSYIPQRLHSICHIHICWVQKWGKKHVFAVVGDTLVEM